MSGTCIVKRGKKFAVVAYAGIDPKSGKQRQKWFSGFRTRQDADQFRITLAHSPAFSAGKGPYGSPRLRTGDYLEAWLRERRAIGGLRPSTADRHEEHCRLHLAPHLGHVPLGRLSPAAIQHLYETLLGRGLSAATVRRAAAVLHKALQDAVRRGLLLRNPQDNTTPPPLPRYDPTVPTPEQIAAYLADARETATPALWAFYVTAVATGMREGELLGLHEDAVDLERGLLTIRTQLVRAGRDPLFGHPKTTRGRRTVLLPSTAADAIRAALRWKREQRLRLGPAYRESGLVFCGPTGRPLNPSNIRMRDHVPRLRRLGLPRFRLHDLRHAAVTHLVAAGVDIRTVADRVGHSSPSFTLATYAHAAVQAQERAAAAANELLTRSVRKT